MVLQSTKKTNTYRETHNSKLKIIMESLHYQNKRTRATKEWESKTDNRVGEEKEPNHAPRLRVFGGKTNNPGNEVEKYRVSFQGRTG